MITFLHDLMFIHEYGSYLAIAARMPGDDFAAVHATFSRRPCTAPTSIHLSLAAADGAIRHIVR